MAFTEEDKQSQESLLDHKLGRLTVDFDLKLENLSGERNEAMETKPNGAAA